MSCGCALPRVHTQPVTSRLSRGIGSSTRRSVWYGCPRGDRACLEDAQYPVHTKAIINPSTVIGSTDTSQEILILPPKVAISIFPNGPLTPDQGSALWVEPTLPTVPSFCALEK